MQTASAVLLSIFGIVRLLQPLDVQLYVDLESFCISMIFQLSWMYKVFILFG